MTAASEPIGRDMTPAEMFFSRIKHRLIRLRRTLPYLVWWNDELDVTITFREAKLPEFSFRLEDGIPAGALAYLNEGYLAEVERALSDIGISFDKGGGGEGRDWEWDWSLRGPVSVKFRARATKPELRQ